MNYLLALFIFLSSFLRAEIPIERTLEEIDYRSRSGETIALIKLSDGSIWKWTPDFYSENFLRKWTKGDPIIVQTVNHPGFILQNLSHPHYTPAVALSFQSYLLFPSIKGYETQHDIVTLSDGSEWQLIYDFNKRTLYHWSIDDRIIPVKGVHENYELVNIDVPYENRSQIERCIEVLPLSPNIAAIEKEILHNPE